MRKFPPKPPLLHLQCQHHLKLNPNKPILRLLLQPPTQLHQLRLPLQSNSLVSREAMSLRHTTPLPSRRAASRRATKASVRPVRQVAQVPLYHNGLLQPLPATRLACGRLGLRSTRSSRRCVETLLPILSIPLASPSNDSKLCGSATAFLPNLASSRVGIAVVLRRRRCPRS